MQRRANQPKALIVGIIDDLLASLPHLLFRAGFELHSLTLRSSIICSSQFITSTYTVDNINNLPYEAAKLIQIQHYDWIILCDDLSLNLILESTLTDTIKEKLLPVISKDYFGHLFSKIGLARSFHEHAVCAPKFQVVNTKAEALYALHEIGMPSLLKIDQSMGGHGTFECKQLRDVENYYKIFHKSPVLVQEFIPGKEFHISALYLDAKLIFFEGAEVVHSTKKFGISILRDYITNLHENTALIDELTHLGKVLGVHGFANITCIEHEITKQRYYFEADIRPTVWVDYAKFYSKHDVAQAINQYFNSKRTYQKSSCNISTVSDSPNHRVRMPFYLRLSLFDLLTNRYNVWHFIPWHDPLVLNKLLMNVFIKKMLSHFFYPFHPKHLEKLLRHFLRKYGWLTCKQPLSDSS